MGERRSETCTACATCFLTFSKDHEYILGRYTTEWDRLNAEVKLAVAVGSRSIDFDAIENFCSEVGFEFVEVSDDLADDESGSECSTF